MTKSEISAWLRFAASAVLRTYAILLFNSRLWVGALVMASTFLAPRFGLMGLAAVLCGLVGGSLFGFEKKGLRGGWLLFNSLLAGLSLAYLQGYQELEGSVLILLLVSVSLLALFISVGLGAFLYRVTGLPALSMPFVMVSLALFFVMFSINGTPVITLPTQYLFDDSDWKLPEMVRAYFQSFGAIMFLPHAGVGVLLAAALLWESRLGFLFSILGFAAGVMFYQGLEQEVTADNLMWLGFNFTLCGIALGGSFFVPSKSSVVLVILGSFFCAVVGVASQVFLATFNIPPLALPFNLVVLLVVYTLRVRTNIKVLHPAPLSGATAEANFREFVAGQLKFSDFNQPSVALPFSGEWVVTQGMNGKLTHRDHWKDALDFEILGRDGEPSFPAMSNRLEDYSTYGAPVNSPVSGKVVKVADGVEDNLIGSNNLERNWGNTVIIRSDDGWHVALSHFQNGGIKVEEGDRVEEGKMLGYCGNSGRSPVPHLHMQVQEGAELGAPTIPFRIKNYVLASDDGEKTIHSQGIPEEGERVEAMRENRGLRSCLDGIVEREICFEISNGEQTRKETITISLDSWGAWDFRSDSCGKSYLKARMIGGWWTVVDFSGGRGSLLDWVWLGLSRFPMMAGACWSEKLDITPLRSTGRRLISDLLEPFTKVRPVKIDSKISRSQGTTWEIESRVFSNGGNSHDEGELMSWQLKPGEFLFAGEVTRKGKRYTISRV